MNIAIWGAGKFGQFVMQQLINKENIQITCIIDRYAEELDDVMGTSVVTPIDFKNKFADKVEFVLVAFTNGVSVIKELKELEIRKFGIISDMVYRYKTALKDNIWEDRQIVWGESFHDNLPILSVLETNVVDYCNLEV